MLMMIVESEENKNKIFNAWKLLFVPHDTKTKREKVNHE
jgi:hypothetical protein